MHYGIKKWECKHKEFDWIQNGWPATLPSLMDRNDSFEFGSATVSVALAGVPLASHTPAARSPFGGVSPGTDVFGETPKTAVETTALPRVTESFRWRRGRYAT
jgi:hypothetical protein